MAHSIVVDQKIPSNDVINPVRKPEKFSTLYNSDILISSPASIPRHLAESTRPPLFPKLPTSSRPSENKQIPKSLDFSKLFQSRSHYSNQELLTQADQLVAGISYKGTQKRYQAKLDYYHKHIDTLNKTDRKQLKELIKDLQRLHNNPLPTASTIHPTLPDQKHQSKLPFGLKQRLWSPPVISSSASSSSSSSSSTLHSSTASSQSASTLSTSTTITSHK